MSADTGSATDAPPPPPPPPPPSDQPADHRDPPEHSERPEPESLGREGLEPRSLEPTPEFESFLADKRAEFDARPYPLAGDGPATGPDAPPASDESAQPDPSHLPDHPSAPEEPPPANEQPSEQPRPPNERPEPPAPPTDSPASSPTVDQPTSLDTALPSPEQARPPENSVSTDDGSPAGVETPEVAVEGPHGRSGGPALSERGDADRLLDEEPAPSRTPARGDTQRASAADPPSNGGDGPVTNAPAANPATPVERPQEVVEPPAKDRVEEAFPDLYHYEERPPTVETEPFRPPEQWVGDRDRNPGYDELEPGAHKNCGDASRSSEYTWRGQDTKAVPINMEAADDGGEDPAVMDHWSPGDRVPATFDGIQRGLEELGPGSSAIVGVDYVDDGGHWFNAFNDKGRIVASDGQKGVSEDWPPGGTLDVTEADCSVVDAIFIDASGRHLTRDDLPKGII